MVKTPPSNAGGTGLIPGRGTKIPHYARCGQKLKNKVIKMKQKIIEINNLSQHRFFGKPY